MAQDVDNVLNKDYNPATPEYANLFQEKKNFMYSIFKRTSLVQQYKSTCDSQIIYKHLNAYYKENTKAALDSSLLLACITIARIDEQKESSESFILNW